MAELKFQDAEIIAGALVTIGHPYAAAAIRATAADIQKWCTGYLETTPAGPVIWTPGEQASWLVEEARLWVDGWPERGGTAKLLTLFREKFRPAVVVQPLLGYEEAVTRGLIAPPCESCHDRLYLGDRPSLRYCTACGAGRHNARWLGQGALDLLNAPAVEPKSISRPAMDLEKMLREAEETYREAKRRKEQQLANLGYTEPVD